MQINEDEPPKETELQKQMRENLSPDDDKDHKEMEQYTKTVATRDTSKEGKQKFAQKKIISAADFYDF